MSSAASQNLIRAGADVNRGLADALENLGEVVEHEVHGVDHVAERVVGDFAADGQVAARHLIDCVEQVGDAALERILRLLIGHRVRHLRGAAIQVLGDQAEFVVAVEFRARACVTGHEPLGKLRELADRLEHALAQHEHHEQRGRHGQAERSEQRSAGACRQRRRIEQRDAARFLARVVREAEHAKQRHGQSRIPATRLSNSNELS